MKVGSLGDNSPLPVCFFLMGLLAERDAFRQAGKATRGLREDGGALWAGDDGVGVGEERGDRLAAGALDVHVERVGGLNHSPELVGLGLDSRGRVKEINGESHFVCVFVSERERRPGKRKYERNWMPQPFK